MSKSPAAGSDEYFRAKALASLCLIISWWGIFEISRYGLASYLITQAEEVNSAQTADTALYLHADSADLYQARGNIFLNSENNQAAIQEFENGLKIRPRDYQTWFQLGYAREKSGDPEGAAEAYRETVRLAPFYGLPRWYLGHLLYRIGNQNEGLEQIRKSFQFDSRLLVTAIRFVWGETRGNAPQIEKELALNAPAEKLVFGLFLIEQGDTLSAAPYICNTAKLPTDQRQMLVSQLLGKNEVRLARLADSGNCPVNNDFSGLTGIIENPGFEDDIEINNRNFGWQPTASGGEKNVQLKLDASEKAEGKSSLKISFNGEVKTQSAVLKQLILVESKSRYRLSFSVLGRELVTDGLPQLRVAESDKGGILLGQTQILKKDDAVQGKWVKNQLEFETGENTQAVWISVNQGSCRYRTCPIFGALWIDDLNLQKIKKL